MVSLVLARNMQVLEGSDSYNFVITDISTVQDVIVGSDMWLDGLDKSPLLGRGGNGRIYKHPLLNEEYAVKLVSSDIFRGEHAVYNQPRYFFHSFLHGSYFV